MFEITSLILLRMMMDVILVIIGAIFLVQIVVVKRQLETTDGKAFEHLDSIPKLNEESSLLDT